MPKRSSKKKRPADTNRLAKATVDEVTSDEQAEPPPLDTQAGTEKNPAAGTAFC